MQPRNVKQRSISTRDEIKRKVIQRVIAKRNEFRNKSLNELRQNIRSFLHDESMDDFSSDMAVEEPIEFDERYIDELIELSKQLLDDEIMPFPEPTGLFLFKSIKYLYLLH